MIIVRNVFQAKYGKGDELVALFKDTRRTRVGNIRTRILTDLSGPFFTVVVEFHAANLSEWERLQAEQFGRPEFADVFARMLSLVESGQREYYTLESDE